MAEFTTGTADTTTTTTTTETTIMSDTVPESTSTHHDHANGTCPFVKNPHAFCAPKEGDSRAPCPALNTLANHGYLPRNGKNLSGQTIVHALEAGYNCSTPLAYFLTYAGILALGQFVDFSLSDLGRHNRIEHNASLVHGDAGPNEYAPTRVVDAALERLLGDSRDGRYLTAEDVGEARVRRESVYKMGIDGFHAEVARGEMALVLGIFGHHQNASSDPGPGPDHVPLDIARTWFKEERLPEGWKPSHRQTLIETVKASTAIRHAMQALRKDETAVEVLKAREEDALSGRPVSIATTSTSTSTSTEETGSSYEAMSTDDDGDGDAGTTTTADDSMEVSTPDTSPTPSRDEVPVWQKEKQDQQDHVFHGHDEEVEGEVEGDCPTPQAIHV